MGHDGALFACDLMALRLQSAALHSNRWPFGSLLVSWALAAQACWPVLQLWTNRMCGGSLFAFVTSTEENRSLTCIQILRGHSSSYRISMIQSVWGNPAKSPVSLATPFCRRNSVRHQQISSPGVYYTHYIACNVSM